MSKMKTSLDQDKVSFAFASKSTQKSSHDLKGDAERTKEKT